MRKIIVHEFITLDGVIQAPGGADEDTEGGFVHGGWTWPYWHDDIGKRFFEAMAEADALLLGRKTWQIHGGAFEPMPAGDPFGDVMNGIPKYVVSTTLDTVEFDQQCGAGVRWKSCRKHTRFNCANNLPVHHLECGRHHSSCNDR